MNKLIIEKDKLKKNIDIIKGLTKAKIIAVVKGNGYGLGLLEYSRFLSENGISLFAVSDINDAVLLSQNGFEGSVILLSPPYTEEEADIIIANNIICTVGSIASAAMVDKSSARLNTIAKVHIKIDTGFGRFGFLTDDNNNPYNIEEVCNYLSTLSNIEVTGMYTHLSFSFSGKPEHINVQYNKFQKTVELMKEKGVKTEMLHICNSSAFLRFPHMHMDAVRIGSAFLGRIPVENTYGLQKIGYLKSNIVEIRKLPSGHNVGYANTYTTKRPTTAGIIPVGFRHGFGVEKSRDTFRFIDILRYIYNDIKSFNKKIYVMVNGSYVPVIGRISMYHTIADLTDINAKTGDEVILSINPLYISPDVKREYI
ncbi:MAG: alanine racemase [Clostridiaceae bacterium]|jgi:alanine racemase|nr:alanine racemase [Clostridiaceae bacterium]